MGDVVRRRVRSACSDTARRSPEQGFSGFVDGAAFVGISGAAIAATAVTAAVSGLWLWSWAWREEACKLL